MQMLMEVSLNSIRDMFASRQQWEANEKRPDCFGELYFQATWEYTKSLDQNPKPGNLLLILNGALLENSADHVCLLLFTKCTQRCRILYFWGKERKEKKGAHDGEYDGVADEGDGAVSQCTARMMDGLWADLLNIKRLWKPLGFSDRQMERGSEREKECERGFFHTCPPPYTTNLFISCRKGFCPCPKQRNLLRCKVNVSNRSDLICSACIYAICMRCYANFHSSLLSWAS